MRAGRSGQPEEAPGSWALCAIGATLLAGLAGWLSWTTAQAVHALPERTPYSPKPQSLAKGPRAGIVTKDRNLVPLLAIRRANAEGGQRSVELDAVRSKIAELQDDPLLTAQAVARVLDRLCRIGLVKRTRQNRYALTEEGRAWLETARREGVIPEAE